MRYKKFSIIVVIILITNFLAKTSLAQNESKFERGSIILELARKKISETKSFDNFTSLFIKINEVSHYKSRDISNNTRYFLEIPNKLKLESGDLDLSVEGASRTMEIWNDSKYVEDTIFRLNGSTHSSNQEWQKLNPRAKKKGEEQTNSLFPNARKLSVDEKLATIMWYEIFPIILSNPFDKDAKFEYVGKAEAANQQRADVVDIHSSYWRKFRLFFDENTHLLLMMTVTTDTERELIEERYFYSSYELTDGLLVCKKIVKENLLTKKTEGNKQIKTITDITIEEFKFNPKFPQNTFKID